MSTSPLGPHRFLGLSARVWLVLLLVTFGALGLRGIAEQTPTGDEHLHLTRGLAFWWEGDSRLSHGHPPFANALQALPTAVSEEPFAFSEVKGWERADVPRVARAYFKQVPEARAHVVRGRLVTLLGALLLLVYVFVLLKEQLGLPTAVAGGALIATHTSVLAHAQLLTTDVPVTALTVVLLGECVRGLQRPGWPILVRIGVVAGLVVSTKHSGGLAILLLAALVAGFAVFGGEGRYRGAKTRRTKQLARDVALVALVALATVNAAFQFEQTFMTVEELRETPPPRHWQQKKGISPWSWVPEVLDPLPVPLPYTFVYGLVETANHGSQGHHSYFMGEVSRRGWPSFFVVLLLVKSPVGVLLLWALGLWLAIRRPTRPSLLVAMSAVLSTALLLFFSASDIHIGIRHALPALLPLLLLAARAAGYAFEASRSQGRWLLVGIIAACAPAAWLAPDYLGDFNVLIGREAGHLISIVGEDWGQDTGRFARLAKRRKYKPLYYEPASVGGIYEPKRFGVNYRSLGCKTLPDRPTYIAVHRTRLWRRTSCYPWLADAKPVALVHDHIEVFHYTPRAPPRGDGGSVE